MNSNERQICPYCQLGNRNKSHSECEKLMQNEVDEANMLSGITMEGGD